MKDYDIEFDLALRSVRAALKKLRASPGDAGAARRMCRALRTAVLRHSDMYQLYGIEWPSEVSELLDMAQEALAILPRGKAPSVATTIRRHAVLLRQRAEDMKTKESGRGNVADRAKTVNIFNFHGRIDPRYLQIGPGAAQEWSLSADVVTQITALMARLQEALPELGLPPDASTEVESCTTAVTTQLGAAQPDARVLGRSLHSIRSILESAAGSVLASKLLPEVYQILASLWP